MIQILNWGIRVLMILKKNKGRRNRRLNKRREDIRIVSELK